MMQSISSRMGFPFRFRQRGLALTELTIACAIGILIVLGLSYVMMNSLQSRNELIKTGRQIENGRHAMNELRKEIQLAGFYSSYFPFGDVQWTMPDPCATTLAGLEFSSTLTERQVPVGLQGYTETEAVPACLNNRLPGTDVLVVRRTATEAIEIDTNPVDNQIDAGIDATLLGDAFYLQVSNCPDPGAEPPFVLSNADDLAAFHLHKLAPAGKALACTQGQLSEIRRYITQLFYVSACNDCSGDGDGIPTLKRVEVSPTPVERSIAEGIQGMQIEFGFDTSGDGTPDTFATTDDAGPSARQWQDVVAVKVFLLARNLEETPSYTDEKIYVMGTDGRTVGPFNDAVRRQVYVSTTMAHNIAGRRF